MKLIEKNATPFQKDITQQLRKVIKWSLIVALLPVWKVWDISSLLYNLILSILVYTFFSRMFDLMLPPVAKHSIVVA